MKHRKIKSEIAFYLQNFDQIEYREYVDRQTRDCCRIIEKESGNKQHTDYFLNYYVLKVKVIGNMCDLKEIGVDEISLQNGNDAYSPHSPKIFYMEDLS